MSTQNFCDDTDTTQLFLLSYDTNHTLVDLHLALCFTECREEVELEAGLRTQTVLQVSRLVLHRREGRHQHLRVILSLLVLTQGLQQVTQTEPPCTDAGSTKSDTN